MNEHWTPLKAFCLQGGLAYVAQLKWLQKHMKDSVSLRDMQLRARGGATRTQPVWHIRTKDIPDFISHVDAKRVKHQAAAASVVEAQASIPDPIVKLKAEIKAELRAELTQAVHSAAATMISNALAERDAQFAMLQSAQVKTINGQTQLARVIDNTASDLKNQNAQLVKALKEAQDKLEGLEMRTESAGRPLHEQNPFKANQVGRPKTRPVEGHWNRRGDTQ